MRTGKPYGAYRPLIREMALYGLIGGCSAAADAAVFYLLSRSCNVYLSNLIGVNIGMTMSFLLNRSLNFGVKDKPLMRAACFFGVGYLGLLLSMGILAIGVDLLHADKMVVKLGSVFLVAAFQFTLNKRATFRR